MKLVHTCFRVLDLDKSIDFYVNKLGCKLLRKFEIPGADATLAFIEVDEGGHQIELTYNHGQTEPYTIGDGFSHIAITVPDLDKAFKEWKAKGVTFRREPFKLPIGSKIAFALDPDGYNIELIEQK